MSLSIDATHSGGAASHRPRRRDFTGIIQPVERLLAWERQGRDACRRLQRLVNYEKLHGHSKLNDVFEAYDADKSGSLTPKEWNKAMEVC